MNSISTLCSSIASHICSLYQLSEPSFQVHLSIGTQRSFGEITSNAALVLTKTLSKPPRSIAGEIAESLAKSSHLAPDIAQIDIAGPGFINISLTAACWLRISQQMQANLSAFMAADAGTPERYLIEYVSANPTGPLHLGHGRGGIIGDVLATVLTFLGHTVHREFYINDAGSQMKKLGASLRARCLQLLGDECALPEDGYAGEYLIDIARSCLAAYGEQARTLPLDTYSDFARRHLLDTIRYTLDEYGVRFDTWFSEKTLHEDGSIARVLELLTKRDLVYQHDGALWFRSTQFGDDKDRVVRKADGELTYIAADIAYHQNKFERGFTRLIDILGQDHHGYVKRLQATMAALGYNPQHLEVILYQLVTITLNDEAIRMSKRRGTFTTLQEVIDTVGRDVARFFYLHRKADAHLTFDLATALKKTDENPVYYVQYAYVRAGSILKKSAFALAPLDAFYLTGDDRKLLAKIASLRDVLMTIATSHETHLLTYYTIELAQAFHHYYASHQVVDPQEPARSAHRLTLVQLIHETLGTCLKLLGLATPEAM